MKKVIDATGLACPLPVIETKKALKAMSKGQLEVVVDNLIALQNLEKMAKQMKLNYQLQSGHDAKHVILITVGEPIQENPRPQGQPTVQNVPGKKVVVLSSDQMGSGDPELGRVLMKAFVYALAELEELPAKILLYNSGVKLAVQGSDSVGDLQRLAQCGVEILNCGTCLDFYKLTHELAVGSITNMYEIAQSQMEATSVIRP